MGSLTLRPDACAGTARAAFRQNPNPLIIFFKIPPPYSLEAEKGVGFVGQPTEKSVEASGRSQSAEPTAMLLAFVLFVSTDGNI